MPVRCLLLLLLLVSTVVSAQKVVPPVMLTDPDDRLERYRSTLIDLRRLYTNRHELPSLRFFLFGMGNRTKFIYRAGRLINVFTGHIEEQWRVRQELIVPPDYLVHLQLDNGNTVQIREDEAGVWILETGRKARRLDGTKAPVRLPVFADRRFGPILRVLHHEILMNIVGGANRPAQPLPNLMVYQRPDYRSAAMMAMVLQQTENLALIRDWIMGLRAPLNQPDGRGFTSDNLGQVLFLVSTVSDKTHPIVAAVLDSARVFQSNGTTKTLTDDTAHPVFQMKWLKFGLRALDLPDPYVIPDQPDRYASVFWPDYRQATKSRSRSDVALSPDQPYLSWAEEHFYVLEGKPPRRAPVGNLDYPLSWERNAPTAHYPGLTVLDKALVRQKLTFPHSWQAAEMFLLLSEL